MRLPDPHRSRAVFIGVGGYRHLPQLRGVHAGAAELRNVLTDERYGSLAPRHSLLVPENAGREEIGRTLATAAGEADDLLLVYFAGHGIYLNELYLTFADTRSEEVRFTGMEYRVVADLVRDSDASSKIVILDCCYSGRALAQRMSAATDLAAEVDIEGAAILTSAPPNRSSNVLDGERYPAYTLRLLDALRNGIPGAPELLNITALHRHVRRAAKAQGLPEPQALSHLSLDELGLVRNRAVQPRQPTAAEPKPAAAEPFPKAPAPGTRTPTQPPAPAPPKAGPAALEEIARSAKSAQPAERAQAYQQLLGEIAAGRVHPGQIHPGPARPQPQPSQAEAPHKGLRAALTFGLHLAYGPLMAFFVVAVVHDLVAGDTTRSPLGTTGYVVAGVVLMAVAAVFVGLTEFAVLPRNKTFSSAGVGSFLAGVGSVLAVDLNFWPLAISAIAVGGCIGIIRALRRSVSTT
ncbi:caspase family protein [Amycolatopsis thermoflava]|uniref:caspase family protein n=1 Tax=Amycolatopsis thermoflava TaxID=84480 RepID=UPI0003F77246|nr:caspase family protein [Amycolatopsis thermoflava]